MREPDVQFVVAAVAVSVRDGVGLADEIGNTAGRGVVDALPVAVPACSSASAESGPGHHGATKSAASADVEAAAVNGCDR